LLEHGGTKHAKGGNGYFTWREQHSPLRQTATIFKSLCLSERICEYCSSPLKTSHPVTFSTEQFRIHVRFLSRTFISNRMSHTSHL
jgi:hypothetical protein